MFPSGKICPASSDGRAIKQETMENETWKIIYSQEHRMIFRSGEKMQSIEVLMTTFDYNRPCL